MSLRAGILAIVVSSGALGASARTLTFEERVEAQGAIERVYYSHQIGATKSFDQAVPRDVLEEKVRLYLEQSARLARDRKTPITGAMLERELARMTSATKMPARLSEIFAALNDDPFVIQECLARATLASRLTRNFEAHPAARSHSLDVDIDAVPIPFKMTSTETGSAMPVTIACSTSTPRSRTSITITKAICATRMTV